MASSQRVSRLSLSKWMVPIEKHEKQLIAGVPNVKVQIVSDSIRERHYEGHTRTHTVQIVAKCDDRMYWQVICPDSGWAPNIVGDYRAFGHVCEVTLVPLPEKGLVKVLKKIVKGLGEMDGIANLDGYVVDEIKREDRN